MSAPTPDAPRDVERDDLEPGWVGAIPEGWDDDLKAAWAVVAEAARESHLYNGTVWSALIRLRARLRSLPEGGRELGYVVVDGLCVAEGAVWDEREDAEAWMARQPRSYVLARLVPAEPTGDDTP